ncbi:MAG: peptidyl-prolyl cis-trans isomerase [Oscillospiraceae bacterium]|nr:peptidyl-prolyl cis-trans isomerase [Oscillospiraceae bacterium]
MNLNKNQKQENSQENPEENYTGILGNFQQQEQSAQDSAATESGKSEKSGKTLKIVGAAVASVAVIGCLALLIVNPFNKQEVSPDTPDTLENSSDQANPEATNSPDLPDNPDAAMYSENFEVTPALMECFYRDYLAQMENAFVYYGIDPETSLKEQMLPEDAGMSGSWFEYIINQAKSAVTQLLIYNEAAHAENYTMTEENKQQVEDSLAEIDMSQYGENVTEEDVRTMIEMEVLAASYFTNLVENLEITEEDLDAYYQEHKRELDTCGLAGYSISYVTPGETTADGEEISGMTKEQAETYATNLENCKTSQEFEDIIREILITYQDYTEEMLENSLPTLYVDNFSYQEGFDVAEWAFSENTKENDTYRIDNDGYISVYFMTRPAGRDETKTVDVRHILFNKDDHMEELAEDADETAQQAAEDAALQACQQLAQDLLAEWESGEKTEDSFAELANTHSEDPGSNTNGGLYENVYTGQMIASFNDWCFDDSRQPGDTGIVQTDYGYHIMYYVGDGNPIWVNTARRAIQSDRMDTWYAEQQAAYPVNSNPDIIDTIEG